MHGETLGQPHAVVADPHQELAAVVGERHDHPARRTALGEVVRQLQLTRPRRIAGSVSAPSGKGLVNPSVVGRKPVLHRVLQQFGEHHGQGSGDLGPQLAGVALHLQPHRPLVGAQPLLDHPHQGPDDLVELHLLAGPDRQGLVHQGDRAHPPHRLLQGRPGLGGRQPAGVEAQQRRDRLQVVLHPVVDLADGGVLGDEHPVPAPQVGHVAHEHDRPGGPAVLEQRDAAHQHHHVAPLDLLGDRQPDGEGSPHRRLVEADLAQAGPVGVAVDPHPVQDRHEVGGGKVDPGGGVEAGHPVTDAGGLVGLGLLRPEGELAGDDHAGEAVEDLDVDPLEVARPAPHRRSRLPGEHAEQGVLPPNGDALHPRHLPCGSELDLAVDDVAQAPGPGHQGPVEGVEDLADLVLAVERLAGGGPDLAQDHEAAGGRVLDGDEEEQVGEAQVGQQSPGAHQALQVRQRGPVEGGLAGDLGEGGHASSLRSRALCLNR